LEYKYYKSPSGRSPVEEFLEGLSDKQAAKAMWAFDLVEQHDRMDLARTRYFKKLEGSDGIWELRVGFGGDIFRFLGFFDGAVFIVAHAFMKKEQRTKKHDIGLATHRKSEFLVRCRMSE
jgi:phage-related protein